MMNKIIVITSGKGGVGKTTTAINLGAAINYFEKDVLVIDGNLSTPNIGVHLGSPEVPINLNHVLSGKAEPKEAVYKHESGLKIMPSSLSIKEMKKPIMGVIVTRVRKNKSEMRPNVVRDMLEVPIIGMIPEDANIQKSIS